MNDTHQSEPRRGTVSNPYDIGEAWAGFDICRDLGRPVICQLPDGSTGRYFPSGRFEEVKR